MKSLDFAALALHPNLASNLHSLGYHRMTPIQAQSLPDILAGRDVIAQAQTGSGKTAAFGLGLLQKLEVKRLRIQALVLCPTRELADQVAKEIRKLARALHNVKVLSLCGGVSIGPQIGSLEHGAHIVVGTPGRIGDHLRKGTLGLDEVNTLVLDEADRMLDMGFQEALEAIVAQLPQRRQTLLFSATYPESIRTMAGQIMREPLMVQATAGHSQASIEQHFYRVASDDQRLTAVRLLLLHFQPESALVFCNTKREAQDVADQLGAQGVDAAALHGDLEQRERDQTLVRFANKSISVLVATDVAARGLDIDALDLIVNYHLARDPEVHVHRIGRTGRAGRKGLACSLFSERELHKLARIESDSDPLTAAEPLPPSALLQQRPPKAAMVSLQIDGGKKQKVRAGDILGALTGANGIAGDAVGKIHLFDNCAYVAVRRAVAGEALAKLQQGKLKGRSFRARFI